MALIRLQIIAGKTESGRGEQKKAAESEFVERKPATMNFTPTQHIHKEHSPAN